MRHFKRIMGEKFFRVYRKRDGGKKREQYAVRINKCNKNILLLLHILLFVGIFKNDFCRARILFIYLLLCRGNIAARYTHRLMWNTDYIMCGRVNSSNATWRCTHSVTRTFVWYTCTYVTLNDIFLRPFVSVLYEFFLSDSLDGSVYFINNRGDARHFDVRTNCRLEESRKSR